VQAFPAASADGNKPSGFVTPNSHAHVQGVYVPNIHQFTVQCRSQITVCNLRGNREVALVSGGSLGGVLSYQQQLNRQPVPDGISMALASASGGTERLNIMEKARSASTLSFAA
jgi:hypothetical protein